MPDPSVLNPSDKQWLVRLAKIIIEMTSGNTRRLSAEDQDKMMRQLDQMARE